MLKSPGIFIILDCLMWDEKDRVCLRNLIGNILCFVQYSIFRVKSSCPLFTYMFLG